MPGTLIPAADIMAAMSRATTYEGLKAELTALVGDPWSAKLDSFADLAAGWDGYKAEPPSSVVIATARRFLASDELSPTRLAPSVAVGVGITFKRNGRKAYLELTNAGAISLLLSDGVNDPHTEPVKVEDPTLTTKIREFLGE